MSVRTFTGEHEGASVFLRQEGCTVVVAGALLASAEECGYETHQLSGRRITVKLQGAAYFVRSSPTNTSGPAFLARR